MATGISALYERSANRLYKSTASGINTLLNISEWYERLFLPKLSKAAFLNALYTAGIVSVKLV